MLFSLLALGTALESLTRRESRLAVAEDGALEEAATKNPWCYLQDEELFSETGEHLVQMVQQVPTCRQCTTREMTFVSNPGKVPLPYHIHGYLENAPKGRGCECKLAGQVVVTYPKHHTEVCGQFECWMKWVDVIEKDTPQISYNSQLRRQDVSLNKQDRASNGFWSQACGVDLAVPSWLDGVSERAPLVALKSAEGDRSVQTHNAPPTWGHFRFTPPGLTDTHAAFSQQGSDVDKDCLLKNQVVDPSFCENAELPTPVLCCKVNEMQGEPQTETAVEEVTEPHTETDVAQGVRERSWTKTVTTVRKDTVQVKCRVVTDYDPEQATAVCAA